MRDAATPVNDSDDEALGDFEDMETGQVFGADGDAATVTALKAIQDETTALKSSKAAKKAAFDSEYDVGESSAVPFSGQSDIRKPLELCLLV